MSRHHCTANCTAGFAVVTATQTEFAVPNIICHLREQICQFFTCDLPQTKFAYAGSIHQRATQFHREYFEVGGGMTPLALLTLAHCFYTQAQPGLDGVQQRGLSYTRF